MLHAAQCCVATAAWIIIASTRTPPTHRLLLPAAVAVCRTLPGAPQRTLWPEGHMRAGASGHKRLRVQVFTITVPMHQEERVHEFVTRMSVNARLTYALAGTSKYEVPCSDIQLSQIFHTMEGAANRGLTVLDWGVHTASLEDVFIRLAQQATAAAEAAAAGGATVEV